jgi:diguanylate cyclase (GGDEF)-like protein/PAS domain S-box-containing protein
MVAYWGNDLRCRFANERFKEWFGRDPETFVGMTLTEVLGPRLLELNEPYIRAALAGSHQIFERALTKPDGTVGYTLAQYTPQFDKDGNVVGFSVMTTDISSLREAQSAERLAASVYDNINEGIIIQATDQTIISFNKAFLRITGYVESEVLGKTTRVFGADRDDETFRAKVMTDIEAKGFWQGDLWSRRKGGELFLASQTSTIIPGEPVKYVSVFSDVTQRWNDDNRRKHLALHDPLTDLPNRMLLQDRLEMAIRKAIRPKKRFAVMFIDLDGFKTVNDRFGHAAGDEVLKATARILVDKVRASDTVARLGGDEFVVILEPLVNLDEVARIVKRMIAALQKPIEVNGDTAEISVSIGVAFFPEHGESPILLLEAADQAMYAAKAGGKNRFCVFEGGATGAAPPT